MMKEKRTEIARCLGYQHAFFLHHNHDNNYKAEEEEEKEDGDVLFVGDDNAMHSNDKDDEEEEEHDAVDMWHLRSLAIQPGGLLDSHGRKLGWLKLAGVDCHDFFHDGRIGSSSGGGGGGGGGEQQWSHGRRHSHTNAPPRGGGGEGGDDDDAADGRTSTTATTANTTTTTTTATATYEQIQKHLDIEMEPSKWHIQRERRRILRKSKRLRQGGKTKKPSTSSSSSVAAAATAVESSTVISHDYASNNTTTTNDLSTFVDDDDTVTIMSGSSSTPLTANFNFRADTTPKSVTFHGIDDDDDDDDDLRRGSFPTSKAFSTNNKCITLESSPFLSSKTTTTTTTSSTTSSYKSCGLSPISLSYSPKIDVVAAEASISSSSPPPPPPQCRSSSRIKQQLQQQQQSLSPNLQKWNLTPLSSSLHHSQKYQCNNRNSNNNSNKTRIKKKKKKDRRPQERQLLVQIATSAMYLLQYDDDEYNYHSAKRENLLNCYRHTPSKISQDLIAVLLLQLESPSLTSLLLKQIIMLQSHHPNLWDVYNANCRSNYSAMVNDKEEDGGDGIDDDDGDDCDLSFATCLEELPQEDDEEDVSSILHDENRESSIGRCRDDARSWDNSHDDGLAMSFFPLLHRLDEKMHDSLVSSTMMMVVVADEEVGNDDHDHDHDDFIQRALAFGKVLHKWMSSWFCCHDTLPLEVVSRVVDFFFASHPSMPLYLSMAILCHPVHRDKLLVLSRCRQLLEQSPVVVPESQHAISSHPRLHEESSSSLLQPHLLLSSSPSPQDRNVSVATMLDNIFTNLPHELLSQEGVPHEVVGDVDELGTHVPKDDCVEWDHDDENELVADFMEEAISTAISFMKQIPPHEIFSLVKEYRNGILASYISTREQVGKASAHPPPLPWTIRSTAPTDYSMIRRRRMSAEKKVDDPTNRYNYTLSRSVVEKHQIALNASGLPTTQLMMLVSRTLHPKYSPTFTSRKVTPTKAALIGISLCVGAQLFHNMKQNPLVDGKMMFLSKEGSPVLGRGVSVGLQSLLDSLKQSKTSQVMGGETTDHETALSSMLSADNGTAPIPEMASLLICNEHTADAIDEKTPVTQAAPGSSSSSESDPTPSHALPPFASEDNQVISSDDTNHEDPEDVPSILIDNADVFIEETPVTQTAHGSSLSSDSDPNPSRDMPVLTSEDNQDDVVNTTNVSLFSPENDESFNAVETEEDYQRLLGLNRKNYRAQQSDNSIHHRVKNYTTRRQKLSAGIKKRARRSLKAFRDGYISLVENDEFFL